MCCIIFYGDIMNNEKQIITFCKNTLILMRKNKLSEKEMMKIMRIGKVSFKKLKSGVLSRNITIDTLMNLCKHFNLFPHEMFNELTI